jgi:hypothetical protein
VSLSTQFNAVANHVDNDYKAKATAASHVVFQAFLVA